MYLKRLQLAASNMLLRNKNESVIVVELPVISYCGEEKNSFITQRRISLIIEQVDVIQSRLYNRSRAKRAKYFVTIFVALAVFVIYATKNSLCRLASSIKPITFNTTAVIGRK